ncbi:MAG TPA: glycosyltransferase [Streptosporangiaceae bacterium]|nr:glycosyltransferase [Streptosporangiaceae bacterium]
MIVKDEEHFLEDCLLSAERYVDEIIIVDTGSSDATKAIARSHTDRLYDYDGPPDDFASARNMSLAHASSDWIFCLDADERLPPAQGELLRRAACSAGEGTGAYFVVRYNIFGTGGFYTDRAVRLFRNSDNLRYEGIVAESAIASLEREGMRVEDTRVFINHFGMSRLRVVRDGKAKRYIQLLNARAGQEGATAETSAQLSLTYRALGDMHNAEIQSDMAIALDRGAFLAWYFRGHLMRSLGRLETAMAAYETALALNSSDPVVATMLALTLLMMGDIDGAELRLQRALRKDPNFVHALVILGSVCEARLSFASALAVYARAAELNPGLLRETEESRYEADPYRNLASDTIPHWAGLAQHINRCAARVTSGIGPA